ncbi:MAG: pyridoxal phosphate-dependent aminotransferase [Candidatus Omnitrophota bacterium]|nr:pyridoxal phosphate-dependent aminotransferase [Candidatus Omnitrophota bacterium]
MRIDTRIAERLKKIHPSSTLSVTSKVKQLKSEGYDVISFAAGEPDFDTPDFIKDAAISAIRSGFTKYTQTSGTLELKKLISNKFKKDNFLNYSPDQICVSCGAKHSIFNALLSLLNAKDEVLIPVPYWVSYPEMVNICEGTARFVKTSYKDNFKITAQDLEKHITPGVKALIINSPSNPTGVVYTKDELQDLADICVKKNIFVISDEIYEKLIYDNLKHFSIASLNKDIYNLTITINGLSKSYSMTGWRIGYLGGPQDIVEAICKLQDHSTSNPTSIAQKAAEAALNGGDDFTRNIASEFQKRRDYCISRLKVMKKINYIVPQGAFYVFCDISKTGLDSKSASYELLNEKYLALIPGEGFGKDDYVRISFAASQEQLEKGLDRLESWLNKFG